MNRPLRTDRLILEPLTGAHAEALWEPMQDPAIYRWISSVPPPSVEGLQRRWTAAESRVSPQGDEAWLGWALRSRSDGAWVGKVDATVAGPVATNVGYFLFPTFWGRGLATEAVRALVSHFSDRGVGELRATVTVGNRASERVLEHAGFVRTRILPANDRIRGVDHDDTEFVRLA